MKWRRTARLSGTLRQSRQHNCRVGIHAMVTFSSRKSGCCRRVNSMAKPFRDGAPRAGHLAQCDRVPIGGPFIGPCRPGSDTSMIRHVRLTPIGRMRARAVARHDTTVPAGLPADRAGVRSRWSCRASRVAHGLPEDRPARSYRARNPLGAPHPAERRQPHMPVSSTYGIRRRHRDRSTAGSERLSHWAGDRARGAPSRDGFAIEFPAAASGLSEETSPSRESRRDNCAAAIGVASRSARCSPHFILTNSSRPALRPQPAPAKPACGGCRAASYTI